MRHGGRSRTILLAWVAVAALGFAGYEAVAPIAHFDAKS